MRAAALRLGVRTVPAVRRSLPAEIAAYQQQGAVCLKNVIPPVWLDTLRRGVEMNRANPGPHSEELRGPSGNGCYFGDYQNWRRIPEYTQFVCASDIARVAGQLMGSSRAAFYHEHVLVKDAGTDKETPYHHDQPYYPINGDQVCSIWIPLDPVPKHLGMRFISGSHQWDSWFMPRKFETGKNYQPTRPGAPSQSDMQEYQSLPASLDADDSDFDVLSWDVQPGDAIAFHMRTLHAAASTTELDHPRRVFVARWLGDDAVFVERPWVTSPPLESEEKWGESVLDDFKYPVLWESAHDIEDEAQCHLHEEEDAGDRMGSSNTASRRHDI